MPALNDDFMLKPRDRARQIRLECLYPMPPFISQAQRHA
jgi:hypothetical protein